MCVSFYVIILLEFCLHRQFSTTTALDITQYNSVGLMIFGILLTDFFRRHREEETVYYERIKHMCYWNFSFPSIDYDYYPTRQSFFRSPLPYIKCSTIVSTILIYLLRYILYENH